VLLYAIDYGLFVASRWLCFAKGTCVADSSLHGGRMGIGVWGGLGWGLWGGGRGVCPASKHLKSPTLIATTLNLQWQLSERPGAHAASGDRNANSPTAVEQSPCTNKSPQQHDITPPPCLRRRPSNRTPPRPPLFCSSCGRASRIVATMPHTKAS